MTLTSLTISGNSYQSYATVAEADQYLAADPALYAAWAALDAADKSRRLVAATRRIDELRFLGAKTSDSQTTAWPRTGLADQDGNAIADDEIPDGIERAAIILSAQLDVELTAGAGRDTSRVRSRRIGERQTSYFYRSRRSQKGRRWAGVIGLLQHWLAGRVSPSGVPVHTGGDHQSEFTQDKYGVEEGIA